MQLSRGLVVLTVAGTVAAAPAPPAFGSAPDSLEITCDVDRKLFRLQAKTAVDVTFKLWPSPTGGSPCGTHTVAMSALVAFKAKTDRYDAERPRKFAQLRAVLGTAGSSGTPVQLCPGDETWLDVQVSSNPALTCDFSANPPQARRRFQTVPFAHECETCVTGPQGPGAIVKDANGTAIGPFEGDFGSTDQTALLTTSGGRVAMVLTNTGGFVSGAFVYWRNTDCTGTPLMLSLDASRIVSNLSAVIGSTLYTPSLTAPSSLSLQSSNNGGGCTSADLTSSVVPATTTDLSGFVPPFHVELTP